MTNSILYRVGLPTFVGVSIIGLWQLMSVVGAINPIMIPSPWDIGVAFSELVTRGYFWQATWFTLQETIYGFAIGVTLGLIIGALTGTFPMFRTAIYPFVIAFQNTPRVALAPIFLTWFGFGMTSKVVMAAVICFFPVVINTVAGMASVGDNAKMLFRSLGASRAQTFFRLTLPGASEIAFAGIKTALTLALLGAIVAEFVGGSVGLGVLIKELNFQLEVAKGFAVVLFLAVIGLTLYGLIELLERYLITWKHD
ncbi:ABC transporter permease [Octadecabacter sp. SW4]|uniref:ABC transporter permease n=1 Tax=Octadecabacter sp. SW4 TaxID=2602067 RepID=UPI0011C1F6AA|nr:ABC transporter permease [Octadecabacter sp. SW4]QEE36108.1 ABC transporter permease [Octadecabacter sp. SW4]